VIKILDAARFAPSGFNRQPWRFIYVENPRVLKMVKNCSPGFYGDAAAAIVIGIEKMHDEFERERVRAFHRQRREDFIGVLDVGFTAENILLAAHSLGLGACAIASFNESGLKNVLNTPENWRIILVISLGYPKKVPSMPLKKQLFDIVYLDEYGKKWDKLESK
jgi:nitroreductase